MLCRAVFPVALAGLVGAGCSSTREFWRYVVEDEVAKPLASREKGERDMPRIISPHNVKVVYNDGATSTEVLIPILSSGQQIIVDHKSRSAPEALSIVPLPPTDADQSIEDAYLKAGGTLSRSAKPVSIVQTAAKIRELAREGNYELALQYAEQILTRYPRHAATLRTKGSLLVKLGEREAALAAYYKAQEIEPSPRVEQVIKELESAESR